MNRYIIKYNKMLMVEFYNGKNIDVQCKILSTSLFV